MPASLTLHSRGESLTQTLSAEEGENRSLPTHYRVEVSLNSSTVHISENINHPISEYTLPSGAALEQGKMYQWRVVAYNETGDGESSEIWNFTTQVAMPAPVTKLAPINKANGVSIVPSLSWTTGEGGTPETYSVVISTNSDLSNPMINETVHHPMTSFYVKIPKGKNTKYYWQVVPSNSTGAAVNNQIWEFTTFMLHTPKDVMATLENNQIRLNWNAPEAGYLEAIRYNVYRNGTKVDSTTTRSYVDTGIAIGSYRYSISAVYHYHATGQSYESGQVHSETLTSEYDVIVPVSKTELVGNYPNPFNPETTIRFDLLKDDFVSIEIFNTKGQKVKTLVNSSVASGSHTVVWNGVDDNGRTVGSGVYFYRMTTGEYSSVKRMMLLK